MLKFAVLSVWKSIFCVSYSKLARPQPARPMGYVFCCGFLARDVIYTSRAYATMSVSVCLSVTEVHWVAVHAGKRGGVISTTSRAMLATARPSYFLYWRPIIWGCTWPMFTKFSEKTEMQLSVFWLSVSDRSRDVGRCCNYVYVLLQCKWPVCLFAFIIK